MAEESAARFFFEQQANHPSLQGDFKLPGATHRPSPIRAVWQHYPPGATHRPLAKPSQQSTFLPQCGDFATVTIYHRRNLLGGPRHLGLSVPLRCHPPESAAKWMQSASHNDALSQQDSVCRSRQRTTAMPVLATVPRPRCCYHRGATHRSVGAPAIPELQSFPVPPTDLHYHGLQCLSSIAPDCGFPTVPPSRPEGATHQCRRQSGCRVPATMMHFRNKTQFAGNGNAQQQCLSSLLFPVLATVPCPRCCYHRGATHRSVGAVPPTSFTDCGFPTVPPSRPEGATHRRTVHRRSFSVPQLLRSFPVPPTRVGGKVNAECQPQ